MSGDRGRLVLRWLITAMVVALLAVAMIRLSQWQWSKHVARDAQIHRIRANQTYGVVPITTVVSGTATVGQRERWRSVRITGTYDPAHQIVVRLRSVAGQTGFEILTPFRGSDGTSVLVDRGLLPLGGSTQRPGSIPAPPVGTTTVSGYLRSPEPAAPPPVGGAFRSIDVSAIAPGVPYPLIDGYLQVTSSTPADSAAFVLLPPPSDDPGPYLSYSVQWVIFAAIAVGGLVFLAVDELRGGRVRQRLRPETMTGQDGVGGAPADPARATRAPERARRSPARPVGVLAGGRGEAQVSADFFDEPGDTDAPPEPPLDLAPAPAPGSPPRQADAAATHADKGVHRLP